MKRYFINMIGARGSSPSPSPDISSGNGEDTTVDKNRSWTLLNLDLLRCPICVEPFTTLIFQCNNGHLACSSCCTKLRNKCPNCTLFIGNVRCRAMEDIVESIIVPCPNSIFGCSEILLYKDLEAHECLFSVCSCPLLHCDYKGHYKDLYHHFDSTHKSCIIEFDRYGYGTTVDVCMQISDKVYVLKAPKECLLFVLQCCRVSNVICVDVSFVAPLGVKLDRFSYGLTTTSSFSRHRITYESKVIMKRIQKVKFGTPEEDFMFVPKYFCFRDDGSLKMKLIIRKLK